MRYRLYENGQYVNTIVADKNYVTQYAADKGYTFEIEDIEQPSKPVDIWDEMAAAYKEGVQEA